MVVKNAELFFGEKQFNIFIILMLRGERADIASKIRRLETCRKTFPKASTMTLQTPMYVAVSPFPTPARPTTREPETSTRIPEHFLFAISATLAKQLLKNFLIDFVV